MLTDRQTDRLDMMELKVAFRSLGTRLKTQTVSEVQISMSHLNSLEQGSQSVCVAVPSLCVSPHSVPCV